MSGVYEKAEVGEYEVRHASKQESIDDLTRLIREAQLNDDTT